jgi:hypothetical protein
MRLIIRTKVQGTGSTGYDGIFRPMTTNIMTDYLALNPVNELRTFRASQFCCLY